ncbi:MAG: hypothetical protein AAGF11_20020 [Myxococcota bacterium]
MGVSDAQGAEEGQQEIPAEFTRPTDPPEVPLPHCSVCEVQIVTSTEEAPGGGAFLDLHYEDDYGNFHGQIELTICLGDDEYLVRTLDDINMNDNETSSFDLDPGETWNWADDVQEVLVQLVPDPDPS